MSLPQRAPTADAQPDLFGVAEQPAVYAPKLEHVLNRLVEMLAAMRAADAWPWDATQLDLYRNYVWPHLLKQLPQADAEQWAADLDAEAERLDGSRAD